MIVPLEQTLTRVLLAALAYRPDGEKEKLFSEVSGEEWRAVIELARRHGVPLLLYHRLKPLRIALPLDVSGALRRASLRAAVRNLAMYRELGVILSRLRERGIPVIVLKGAQLAAAVYENIALRTMIDLDLLVKSDDLLRVEQELLALGCEPRDRNRVIANDNHHFLYTWPQLRLVVEVHWTILAAEYPCQIDIAGLWARAQPAVLEGTPALTLSPEDLILHLCIHTAYHTGQMRLKMLCDIGEVIRRYGAEMDWPAIGTRARQWGIVRAVYVLLRLAREWLEAAVPADWLAALRPEGLDERYLVLVGEQFLNREAGSGVLESARVAKLWSARGLGAIFSLVRDSLWLSRETMARMYPAPANSWRIWLYYPVRVKDALARHHTTVWGLARGDVDVRAAAARTNAASELRDWLMSV